MDKDRANLKKLIEDIQKDEIMLPDFQRKFTWNIEKQKALVASVLTMLPVGGILLLEAKSDEYKTRKIGLKSTNVDQEKKNSTTKFLLDGQQRMTCLTNVFSDVIHAATDYKISKLSNSNLLANRFYLKIPKWKEDLAKGKDLFGIKSLQFQFDMSKDEEPNFYTENIIDDIEVVYFTGKDKDKPYFPKKKYDEKLDFYCMQESEYYKIPLFLLISLDSKDDDLRKKRLRALIKKMTEEIGEAIKTCYRGKEDNKKKKEFAYSVLSDNDKEEFDVEMDELEKENKFDELVQSNIDSWQSDFKNYLEKCITNLWLNKMDMPERSRERAIDIYENMNKGGQSLNNFDLVAARVAKVSSDDFFYRIKETLLKNSAYNTSTISDKVKKHIPKNYNASREFEVFEKGSSNLKSNCSNLFLEVLGLYCNNKNYDSDDISNDYSKSKCILNLTADQINDNCEQVCIALDRTFAFLQMQCGVQKLSDVNFKIMMRFIAYIFTNNEWYQSEKIHKRVEAWYWTCIFSGEFDKDQNERFAKNLSAFLKSIESNDYSWLKVMLYHNS